jgi:hypothetical protein
MNLLEDAFWTARAVGLAAREGPCGRAAVLVRRGRTLGERVARSVAGPWGWLVSAAGNRGGGTLYLSFTPTAALIEEGRRARVARIVTPDTVIEVAPQRRAA